MKKITLKDILEIPQFNTFIYAEQLISFIPNKKHLEEIKKEIKEYDLQLSLEFGENLDRSTSVKIGRKLSDKIREILLREESKVNLENLILFLGDKAAFDLSNTYTYNNNPKVRHSLEYSDGEIILSDKIDRNIDKDSEVEGITGKVYKVGDVRSELAEAILIANSLLPRKKIAISTFHHYFDENGADKFGKSSISREEIYKTTKLDSVIFSSNFEKFSEYIEKRLLQKKDIIRFLSKGIVPEDIIVNLMIENPSMESDILKKVFNVGGIENLVDSFRISFSSKLLLYSAGKIDIEKMEEIAEKSSETELQIPKEKFSKLSKYYKQNITKIAELITHNVLDFTRSMEFLDSLVQESAITSEDRTYLVGIMNDFKTNEFLNNTENVKREHVDTVGPKVHSHGVTIDPKIRKQYFKSIGNVKEIFIDGQVLMKDDSEGVSKKNSLDGYQLILIADKKIAVLEKFYEVTRDKEGNIVYKKDENGNLIAAVENATYVMPIAMAKDFAEKKNKQELRKSPYVIATSHTMNWVQNTEQAMEKVAERVGLQVEFEKENTEKWSKLVTENYKKLKEKREKNVDDLL